VTGAASPARQASRVARWAALGSTLLLAVYLAVTLRSIPPAWRATGRTIAAVAAVAWYYLTYRIVKRVALEWLK
jgi:hypothetical protein